VPNPSRAELLTIAGFLKEVMDPDFEPFGDLQQCRDGRRHLIVFDLGQQRLGEPRHVGKRLQSEPLLLAQAAHLLTKFHLPDFLLYLLLHVDTPSLCSYIGKTASRVKGYLHDRGNEPQIGEGVDIRPFFG
jgi:hypothetical protein